MCTLTGAKAKQAASCNEGKCLHHLAPSHYTSLQALICNCRIVACVP